MDVSVFYILQHTASIFGPQVSNTLIFQLVFLLKNQTSRDFNDLNPSILKKVNTVSAYADLNMQTEHICKAGVERPNLTAVMG